MSAVVMDQKLEYPIEYSDDGDSEEVEGRDGNKRSKGNDHRDGGVVVDWRELKLEESLLQDPLVAFGSDIMMAILKLLDARGVALSLLVSRGWNGVASSDRIWTSKCEELMLDGKRTRIRKEDLCDHAWTFNFNKVAPEYWRKLDPFLEGTGPKMRRYFHLDGSQTADPDDKVWGGHESCYCTVTSFAGDEGKIREHYVRINRSPGMTISRNDDWSWDMSNALCSYSSIPDPGKEGGTGPMFIFS